MARIRRLQPAARGQAPPLPKAIERNTMWRASASRDRLTEAGGSVQALIVAPGTGEIQQLVSELAERGVRCRPASDAEQAHEELERQPFDLLLVRFDQTRSDPEVWQLLRIVREERQLPVIALLSSSLPGIDHPALSMDDFAVPPWDAAEIVLRWRRIMLTRSVAESESVIACGDLMIDMGRCEVSLGRRPLTLTFREYELLKFLVGNRGRVFSRETLLNRVWGYDYYGGDRTIDVHIRRLRSKIEDATHRFIDTVRNVGYRFREE